MKEVVEERNLPSKDDERPKEVDYFFEDYHLYNKRTGEIIKLEQVERRLPGREKSLIGTNAGTLLRLICKSTGMNVEEVYERAKRVEEEDHLNPNFPEMKYLFLGFYLNVFRWPTPKERAIL